MAWVREQATKLIWESDDKIMELLGPDVTISYEGDRYRIAATGYNMKVTMKLETEEEEKMVNKIKTRKDRFPKDGGKPVKASVPGYDKIPWFKATLTLIAQSPDGQLHYAKTTEEKKFFAWSNFDWILVCWPGVYSQDIFLIEDMDAFRRALGFVPREEYAYTDEDGEEWVDTKETRNSGPAMKEAYKAYFDRGLLNSTYFNQ